LSGFFDHQDLLFSRKPPNIPTAILRRVVAIEQAQLRQLPPGILPPLVIKYSASSIPIIPAWGYPVPP